LPHAQLAGRHSDSMLLHACAHCAVIMVTFGYLGNIKILYKYFMEL
jgi:hypothetical protein